MFCNVFATMEETVRIIVRGGSRKGRSESTVGRICETSKF